MGRIEPIALRKIDRLGIATLIGDVGNWPLVLPKSLGNAVADGRGGDPGGG